MVKCLFTKCDISLLLSLLKWLVSHKKDIVNIWPVCSPYPPPPPASLEKPNFYPTPAFPPPSLSTISIQFHKYKVNTIPLG